VERQSEQTEINPICRKVPLILKVLTSRTNFQMLRIDATTIIAAMADHVIITRQHLIQDAEDEAVGRHLPPLKPHLSGVERWRLNAASVRLRAFRDQGGGPRTSLLLIVLHVRAAKDETSSRREESPPIAPASPCRQHLPKHLRRAGRQHSLGARAMPTGLHKSRALLAFLPHERPQPFELSLTLNATMIDELL